MVSPGERFMLTREKSLICRCWTEHSTGSARWRGFMFLFKSSISLLISSLGLSLVGSKVLCLQLLLLNYIVFNSIRFCFIYFGALWFGSFEEGKNIRKCIIYSPTQMHIHTPIFSFKQLVPPSVFPQETLRQLLGNRLPAKRQAILCFH